MIAAERGNTTVATLAVLLPMTALLLVILPDVANMVSNQSSDDLPAIADAIGARTMQRLTTADHELRVVASDVVRSDTPSTISTSSRLDAFSNVALIRQDRQPVVIKGEAPVLENLEQVTRMHLLGGRTALVTKGDGPYRSPTLLRTVTLSGAEQPYILAAELWPGTLWRDGASEHRRSRFCITDGAGNTVFCEQSPPSDHRLESGFNIAAIAAGTSSDESSNAFSAIIDLDPKFAAGRWTITVSDNLPGSFFATHGATLVYMLAGMGAMLGSLAVAWHMNRRKKSVTGSRSATPQEAHRAEKQTAVASKPATQVPSDEAIRAMRLFSEIDRAILSGASFERIIDSVLNRITGIFPGTAIAMAVLDRERPAMCKLLLTESDGTRAEYALEQALDARSTSMLGSVPDGDWFDTSHEDALLAPLHSRGIGRSLLVPVFRDGVPAGVLMIAERPGDSLAPHDHEVASSIAHRLGVAYTATMRAQELLFHSMYDSTTELPNRKFFENRLEEEISRARRESNPIALLLVDLDKFKEVNDSYGHEAGDVLLEQSSARLKTCLRTEDLVARIGSDEFAILLPTIADGRDVSNVAQKLIDALSESFQIQGRDHHLTASIGIAVFPKDGKNSRALLSGADFAMNAAKRSGGATYSSYESHSNVRAQDRTALTNDLRQAISKQELALYYQPQIDLGRGEVVGVEALLRWKHPTRGLIMPTEFVNIAEQSDLIEQIGDFVRQEASKQFRAWEAEGIAPMRVAINVSSRELRSPDFLEKIETTLLTSGMRPFSLELEITESLLLEQSDHVVAVLKALNNRGVRIAIDDFGTGYSSMAYLKKIPFHVLKIDRLFVKDIGAADDSDSIVHAILGIAQGLGKEVVSEGIETEDQRRFLEESGCDIAQGFLWSEPVPADEFEAFMHHWNDSARKTRAAK